MSSWSGVANCPKCGGQGTLIVHGETSTLEIDGCWVCGFGRNFQEHVDNFIPLKNLRVQKPGMSSPTPNV
jgi:hypothetical protein